MIAKGASIAQRVIREKSRSTDANDIHFTTSLPQQDIVLHIKSFRVPMNEEQHKKNVNRPKHPKISQLSLQHTLTGPRTGVLLVTKDYPRTGTKRRPMDFKISNDHFKDLLREAECNHLVSDVMSLSELREAYSQEKETLEQLEAVTDVVLCDSGLVKVVPRLLGPIFNHNGKLPRAIKMRPKSLKPIIENALRMTSHKWTFRDQNSSVVVGHTLMDEQELAENLVTSIVGLEYWFPGGWKNVAYLCLMVCDIPIPLYVSKLKSADEVGDLTVKPDPLEVYEDDIGLGDVRVDQTGTILSNLDEINFVDEEIQPPRAKSAKKNEPKKKKNKGKKLKPAKRLNEGKPFVASKLPMMTVEEGIDYVE